MKNQLLIPLSSLIVATREKNPSTAATFLAQFNAAGDAVLPKIEQDMSKPANALHSAVVNVRAHPGDLAGLEQIRSDLMRDIS